MQTKKVMKEEELRSYLLKCGHDKDVIDQFFKEEDAEIDIDQLASQYNDTQKEVYRNDPDFIKPLKEELEASIKGKERGSVERAIMRAFGITSDEAREHGLGESYEKLLKYANEKTGKNKDKTVEEVQTELKKALDRVKQLEEEEIPSIKNAQNEEINNYFKRMHIERLLDNYADKLVAKKDAFIPGLREYLTSRYDIALTDDRSDLVIKTKDGTDPLNADKTKKLTKEDIVSAYLESIDAIKRSHGGGELPRVPGTPPKGGEEPKYTLPGMQAAKDAERQQMQHKSSAFDFGAKK